MNLRTTQVLQAIIDEYVQTAMPVGSLGLVSKYRFDFSPATVRMEMAELEKEGYIRQPHTSAGRVPTEKGYRFYIQHFNSKSQLSEKEEYVAQKRLSSFENSFDRALKETAKMLAEVTDQAALSGTNSEFFYFGLPNLMRQPEFLDFERGLALAELFERLSEISDFISPKEETEVLIGGENPFGKGAGCSLILSWFETPYQTAGYIGILGPIRMDYGRNISWVKKAASLLDNYQ